MDMVNIDAKLLETLQNSTCFGIAYNSEVPECKQCDVASQCKSKCQGAQVEIPEKDKKLSSGKASSSSKKTTGISNKKVSSSKGAKASDKNKTKTNSNMPDFKPMSLDELKEMAEKNSIQWKDYGNDNITRMRLIMSLKSLYK